MFNIFIRTVILYFTVILVIRLMGKRQIGEIQPYELVITIMLSDLASLPMQDPRLPLLLGVIPMVTLLMIKMILTQLQLKSSNVRRFLDGTPVLLIKDGRLQIQNMTKQKIAIDDILSALRTKGILDINQVQFAILENDGTVSVFPKEDDSPVTKKDLKIQVKEKVLPRILYIEGQFVYTSLKEIKKDQNWLCKELKKIGAPPMKELFLVILRSDNKFYIETKKDYEKGNDII